MGGWSAKKGGKMELYILMRANKKTGNVDTCMTGVTRALMKMWALQHTTKTKRTLIFERSTGRCLYYFDGVDGDMPNRKDYTNEFVSCEEFGIPLEQLQMIEDDRFDN